MNEANQLSVLASDRTVLTDERCATIVPNAYQALAVHQEAERWQIYLEGKEYDVQETLAELHHWQEIFISEFKLEIPVVPLRVCKLRVTRLGHFMACHNDFGLRSEIAINVRYLVGSDKIEWWKNLGTLLHEQLHHHQQLHGKPGKNNYHNQAFQAKARTVGFLVDHRGYQNYLPKEESPFLALLDQYGVKVPAVPEVAIPLRGSSKLKKWSCQCPEPFNVRVARAEFWAKCLYCKKVFVLRD